MQITEKLLKPLPEVQYLNTENTDRYRCIMRIFYENTEKLHNWMYQEEVYDALRAFPEFRDYRLEQCQQDLTSLVNWHNLETLQDTRHVSSLEEFQSRRYRYQMSPYSVEIERLVLRLEHLEIEGGSLEPTLLERIRRAIERFPDMVDAEPAEAYDFWDDLERNFTRLNQNYHDYIRDLSSVRAEEMMHTQEFLLFKDKLVEYLRNFVTSLQRNVGVIEELLDALSPSLCEVVLEKVNAYEAAIPRMEQVAPETIAENNRGKLESIRRWFQTSEGEDNEAGKLFDATNDIIRRITRFAMVCELRAVVESEVHRYGEEHTISSEDVTCSEGINDATQILASDAATVKSESVTVLYRQLMSGRQELAETVLLRVLTEDLHTLVRALELLDQLRQEKRYQYLPVFAAELFGEPHRLDPGTRDAHLLQLLLQWLEIQRGVETDEMNSIPSLRRQARYLSAGILLDDVSNYAMLCGVEAVGQDGQVHAGMAGFAANGAPVNVPLSVITGWTQLRCRENTLWIVENPVVYAVLCERFGGTRSLMCMNGQPRLSAWLILKLLRAAGTRVYYAGDFDPEGLCIAEKVQQSLMPGQFSFWHMSEADYRSAQSQKPIDNRRLKMLDHLQDPLLQKTAALIRQQGVAGYQENILQMYLSDENT